jgi:hypothetical protein
MPNEEDNMTGNCVQLIFAYARSGDNLVLSVYCMQRIREATQSCIQLVHAGID